jgi:transcriptional regulator with XRE-family HTH domain
VNDNKFGRLLKEHRQGHGLTQRELAVKIAVKASHVAYLETGQRKPSLALLGRIADTFHLDKQKLFLLSHPEARSMMPSIKPTRTKNPREAWRTLVNDRALLGRYQVTKRELQALKHLSLLGHAITPQQFVAVVTLIRRDPEEE